MDEYARRILLTAVVAAALAVTPAHAQDDDDDDNDDESGLVVSVDLFATYLRASGFPIGFGVPRLSTLTLTSPSSSTFAIDAPLKVEIDGWFTVYAGVGGAASKSGSGSWTPFKPENWKAGFSADIVTQDSGQWMPSVTVTGSVSRPLDNAALIQTTTWTTGFDLDLAVDMEQTRGLLAGALYTRVTVEGGFGTIRPLTMLYAGAYRQVGEWKLSATAGMQFFRGAAIANLVTVKPVDMSFIRAELEKLDEDDNRLLAVAAAVGWSPKPSFQLTLNVPLYLAK